MRESLTNSQNVNISKLYFEIQESPLYVGFFLWLARCFPLSRQNTEIKTLQFDQKLLQGKGVDCEFLHMGQGIFLYRAQKVNLFKYAEPAFII